jgi:hypothetical protein
MKTSPKPKPPSRTSCRHSIFHYETEKRKHQVCCACGRRRWIKFEKDGRDATVGKWVTPRKKKEKTDASTNPNG